MCSSKNTRKLSLHSILNIELFPTHTESKLGVLGVAGKLVKDIVQLWWRNFEKKSNFFSNMLPKQQTTKFWFQGIFGLKISVFILSYNLSRTVTIYQVAAPLALAVEEVIASCFIPEVHVFLGVFLLFQRHDSHLNLMVHRPLIPTCIQLPR
jgi:hypothetical protein